MDLPDFSQFAFAGFIIIGFVNGFKMAWNKDWESFFKFSIAIVAGGLFGLFGLFGLPSIEMGLGVGLFSSGVYKLGQTIRGK